MVVGFPEANNEFNGPCLTVLMRPMGIVLVLVMSPMGIVVGLVISTMDVLCREKNLFFLF